MASKKATTQPDPEESQPDPGANRRAIIFVTIFVILIIAIPTGFILINHWQRQQATLENRYNGFDFSETMQGSSALWVTEIVSHGQPYYIPFYHHPREVEGVVLEQNITDRFVDPAQRPKLIYITFSPDAGSYPVVGGVEISRITGFRYDLLNIETHSALKEAMNTSAEHIVVTCENATEETAVLSFDEGKKNFIYRDSRDPWCVHLEYMSKNDSIMVADRFAYGLLRIMPG